MKNFLRLPAQKSGWTSAKAGGRRNAQNENAKQTVAKPELEACPFFLRHPEQQKGRWHEWFPEEGAIHLELGCGKGYFIAGLAPLHPELHYIGIDLKDVILAPAKRVIEAAFDGKPIHNVALTGHDIERLREIMGERRSGGENLHQFL